MMSKKMQSGRCVRCKQFATHRTRLYGKNGVYYVLHCGKHAMPGSQPLEEATGQQVSSGEVSS